MGRVFDGEFYPDVDRNTVEKKHANFQDVADCSHANLVAWPRHSRAFWTPSNRPSNDRLIGILDPRESKTRSGE